ncbi:MAG: hypothetical protein K8T10_18205 [Candidatus Eremiobacteraeota bacterium]|nr:hypothetical protein [Candidatus Eremiobacteraeota bacterium]
MEAIDTGFFAIYKYLFIIALLLIGGISIFVILGIKKAQQENKELANIQQGQLDTLKECLEILKEIRTCNSSDKQVVSDKPDKSDKSDKSDEPDKSKESESS